MSSATSIADQLDLLIRARTPILWIRSLEEQRLERLLEQLCRRLGGRLLLRWDFVGGLEGRGCTHGCGGVEVSSSPAELGSRVFDDLAVCFFSVLASWASSSCLYTGSLYLCLYFLTS